MSTLTEFTFYLNGVDKPEIIKASTYELALEELRRTYKDADVVDVEGLPFGERACTCGSGILSEWVYDARGIELCRVCTKCRQKQLSKYRGAVLNDSHYDCDEPIYEED